MKEKDCFYLKADKGNAIVIYNKKDYFDGMYEHIDESPYEKFKIKQPRKSKLCSTPVKSFKKSFKRSSKKNATKIFDLTKWINDTDKLIKTLIIGVFPEEKFMFKFRNPNPSVPKMSGFPKIHKPGNKFRPLVSNPGSPTEKLSKWLINEFNGLTPPKGASVKNAYDLVSEIKNIQLEEEEILVSFDVTSLFPNVPIEETMDFLHVWLKSNKLSGVLVESLMKLTKHCVNNCFFLFNGEIFKQIEGLSMGSPLSPFLANLFLSYMETELAKHS